MLRRFFVLGRNGLRAEAAGDAYLAKLAPVLLALISIALLVLAACQSDEEVNSEETPTTTPSTTSPSSAPTETTLSPTGTPIPPTTPTPMLEGLLLHLNLLARIKPEDVEDTRIEDVVWTDGCMELSEPALCTLDYGNGPGQRVTFLAGKQEWIYHIGPGGFLFAGRPGAIDETLVEVREHLSGSLGVPIHEIETSKIERLIWADDCLELPRPLGAGVCVLTAGPGYRITLLAGGREYAYHADRLARWGFNPAQWNQ